MEDLKDYRKNELRAYVIANIALVLFLSGILDVNTNSASSAPMGIVVAIANSAIFTAATYCYAVIFESMLPEQLKHFSIYLGFTHRPGETIFSDIAKKNCDMRFTSERARERYAHIYSRLPETKKLRFKVENEEWYALFNTVRAHKMIYGAHKDYLICRSLYCTTFALLFLYLTAILCSELTLKKFVLVYFGIMLVSLNIATRFNAKRLAYNVIALDVQQVAKREENSNG